VRPLALDAEPTLANMLATIRRLALHPMTIIGAIVLVGLWLVVVVAEVSRSRRG